MKIITQAVVVVFLGAVCLEAEPQNIPVSQLDSGYSLIGKLHVRLNEVVKLEGVVVDGPFKGYEGGFNLRVQKIQGRATQEDIHIVIHPFRKWGATEEVDGTTIPILKMGMTYEMVGYETGGYVGITGKVFEVIRGGMQLSGLYFQETFVVIKAKEIEPVLFEPAMFRSEYALIQGQAESRQGKSFLIGDGWSVVVVGDSPWPKHVEGKQIETWGMYNPEGIPLKTFDLVDGQWRLVRLEDQLGQEVRLRGRARVVQDQWWFNYRGVDLYVENLDKLPGWTSENHWKPVEIRGRLEKAKMPRLDQVHLKENRDLQEYFIIRNAKWSPLPSLLNIELPSDDPE